LLSPFYFGSSELDKLGVLVLSLLFKPILWDNAVIVFEPILDAPFCIG
jgi:hypothetical protein